MRMSHNHTTTPAGSAVSVSESAPPSYAVIDGWVEPDYASATIYTPENREGVAVYIGSERIVEVLTSEHVADRSASMGEAA